MSESNTDIKEVLTINEAAALLRVHHNRIREWIKQGKLPALQFVPGGAIRLSRQVIFELLEGKNGQV